MNDWLQRNFKTLALALLWLLSLGGVAFLVRRPAQTPIEIVLPPTATMTPLPTETPTPAPLRVHVSGAVLRPDVYVLAPDAIVRDAITAAGGFDAQADQTSLNLAQPLYDGAQVHVPSQVAEITPPPVEITRQWRRQPWGPLTFPTRPRPIPWRQASRSTSTQPASVTWNSYPALGRRWLSALWKGGRIAAWRT